MKYPKGTPANVVAKAKRMINECLQWQTCVRPNATFKYVHIFRKHRLVAHEDGTYEIMGVAAFEKKMNRL